ncbi:hypothetical protein BKA69DRAFT_1063717 [Paraphysoderma sedebokerense]|nr:hypothetical protein BKA69DRAFT_1063717 [Paraphysoderma sedebokerense]
MSTAVPRPGPPLASRLWFNILKCCSSERPFFADIRNTFSLMSYNILSDTLMRRNQYLYPHCRAQHANWKYRNSRLKRTIAEYAPDVLCINELEPSVFKEWKRHNIFRNYRAFYIKRSDSEIEEYPDGEAIFVSRKKFDVLECNPVSLNVNELSDRGNVALVLICQYISDDKGWNLQSMKSFSTYQSPFNKL